MEAQPSAALSAGEVTAADVQAVANARARVLEQLRKRIIGQDDVIDLLLTALFAQGHGLFIGVPGLAKTLLISTLAEAVSLDFNRVQFTPDLMPSDITGTDILEEDHSTGKRFFKFIQGPVFCNILLADEINRTPPKTQAALLQAMQEKRVTAAGTTYPLEPPFLVFATQNPIEQEGTYPLPEAQLDRFMFSIRVEYPSFEEEIDVVTRTTGAEQAPLEHVLSRDELLRFQQVVRAVVAAPDIVRYAVELTRRTRPDDANAPDSVKQYVSWGAGPRASQYLVVGAKARAALHGRPHASRDDVRALARAVLGHRVLMNFQAEADRVTAWDVIDKIVASVPASSLS
ncbi:MAG: MoxR family ATPase [Deltaproteobacteria bacterium]|nr:MAG: MoxR family ATPase [Deltaproteobacteria bacterium]